MPLIDRAKPVDIDRMRAEGQIPLSPARISEDISKVREKMEQLVPLFEETAQLQKDSSALVEKLLDLNTRLGGEAGDNTDKIVGAVEENTLAMRELIRWFKSQKR